MDDCSVSCDRGRLAVSALLRSGPCCLPLPGGAKHASCLATTADLLFGHCCFSWPCRLPMPWSLLAVSEFSWPCRCPCLVAAKTARCLAGTADLLFFMEISRIFLPCESLFRRVVTHVFAAKGWLGWVVRWTLGRVLLVAWLLSLLFLFPSCLRVFVSSTNEKKKKKKKGELGRGWQETRVSINAPIARR